MPSNKHHTIPTSFHTFTSAHLTRFLFSLLYTTAASINNCSHCSLSLSGPMFLQHILQLCFLSSLSWHARWQLSRWGGWHYTMPTSLCSVSGLPSTGRGLVKNLPLLSLLLLLHVHGYAGKRKGTTCKCPVHPCTFSSLLPLFMFLIHIHYSALFPNGPPSQHCALHMKSNVIKKNNFADMRHWHHNISSLCIMRTNSLAYCTG